MHTDNGRTVLAHSSANKWGKLSHLIDPLLFTGSLYGAEDPPTPPPTPPTPPTPTTPSTDPATPPVPPEDPPTDPPTDPPVGDPKDPDTFDRAYVEKLRKEAAEHRVKAQKLQDEKTERERAEMDELTRAQAERDEEKTKRETAEQELSRTRLQMAVTTAAVTAEFYDPEDALSLIPAEGIALNEDGTPNKQSVEAAVKRLGEAKPHLVKGKVPGSGDGGARGKGPATLEDKKAEHGNRIKQLGGVPRPKRS